MAVTFLCRNHGVVGSRDKKSEIPARDVFLFFSFVESNCCFSFNKATFLLLSLKIDISLAYPRKVHLI